MNDRRLRFTVPIAIMLFSLPAAAVAVLRLGYLTNAYDLGMLIFLQVIVAAVWKYRQVYFPVMLTVFLLAGVDLTLASAFLNARWLVLGVGALAGYAIYMRDRSHYFGIFHLVGLFCIVSAFASVVVSWYPNLALLKAISLLLLFLYCAAGARLAILRREEAFLSGLLIGCEVITYASAASSYVLGIDVLGNPNSLGAVMGIVVVPVLLWGVLVAERPLLRQRRAAALLVALLLLLSSFARAGITGAAVAFVILCFGLRRYRLLMKGSAVAVLMAVLVLVVFPREENDGESSHGVVSDFVYKGKRDMGVLGSRRSAWQHTMGVIQQNPWFGSGFGTSLTAAEERMQLVALASAPEATREHGSSYLAILEWVGLLGVVPFFALVFLSASNVVRVLTWVRRTGTLSSPAVPIALVIAAGLVHAAFEDWMFAAGYYMSPLFWSFAFVCVDMIRDIEGHQPAVSQAVHSWAEMPPLVAQP